MAVAYIYGSFLEKTAHPQDRARVLRLTWPGRMRAIRELSGRVGRVPRRGGLGRDRKRACGPGKFSQAPNLARLRSCLRAPQRRHAPAAPGRRLDQCGRLPHRQGRRLLTPPGYGSARRRRRPWLRNWGSRWWRVPTPSCSGVGEVGLEFEGPAVPGDRPSRLALRGENLRQLYGDGGENQEQGAALRRTVAWLGGTGLAWPRPWPEGNASLARSHRGPGRFPVRSQPHGICP